MSKKLISILLVIVMVAGLFPTAALADDAATGDVAVMVYGKAISDLVCEENYTLDNFEQALKDELQGYLANEKLPDVEMCLVSKSDGTEYPLNTNTVPSGAAFLSSFKIETGGIIGWIADVYRALQTLFGWLVSDVDTLGELYKIYGAENVPVGEYTLEIKSINGDGYTLWAPSGRNYSVTVQDGGINYLGYNMSLGSFDISIWGVDIASAKLSMPGVFLKAEDPAISFTSADMGGNALPGTEFMLINRDEVEKIVKASVALGKDTFTNAMELIGTEGFTWDELSLLNKDLLTWDEENQQISLNDEAAYKLLCTYWALVEASATEPLIDFMSNDTDLRLPAILKATADENGIVRFTEDSNVTLVWSMRILLKLGDVVLEEADNVQLLNGVFKNETTEAMVNLAMIITHYAVNQGLYYSEKYGEAFDKAINDWLYPILRNDNVMEYAKDAIKSFMSEEDVTQYEDVLKMLPTHAILTPKMPTGNYILLQSDVPDGYFRSPLFYTVKLEWNTEAQSTSNWVFASVANCGVVLPYYAEQYYTYLRQFDLAESADSILDNITAGKLSTLIQDTLSDELDVTEVTIAYQSYIIYWYMGGRLVYDSQEALAADLTEYLYSYGRTSQNLMIFANKVLKESKSVITGELDTDWTFYSISTSPRTNIALTVQSVIGGLSNSIEAGDSKVLGDIKQGLKDTAGSIDTENHILEETTEIIDKVESTIKDTAEKIGTSMLKSGMKFAKNFITWLGGVDKG